MEIRNNSNFTSRPTFQNLALPSAQQVLLEQSGGHVLSAMKAEDVNAQLNQMDASNSLNISQQINSVGIESGLPVNNSGSNSSASLHLPDSAVANILSFSPNMITTPMSKGISNGLLLDYKETIVNRLSVTKEMVDSLERSDIIFIFHKLNKFMETDPPTALVSSALTMGFSLKQIMSIPSDQLSDYKAQFNAYVIPVNIQNQIDNLSEINGRLNLNGQELRTGQLCKILNALTDNQQNALTELYLYNNQLTSLPNSFGRLTTLTGLSLGNNQLTSLPDSFGSLSSLTNLYLHNNQLTALPDSFGRLTALTELSLSENQLASLPDSLGRLTALTELHLYENQLTSLPDWFGNLSALTRLDLEENQLTSIPDSFGRLTALTELRLDNNRLTSLPDSFGRFSALTWLRLDNNQLTSLPHSFGNLTALTKLYLYENQLTSLPDSFGNLSALTKLELDGNQLTSLPDSFGRLTALTELWLRGNNFDDNLKQAIQQRFNFATL